MADRALIATGAIGAALAVVCCATPLLAVVLGGVGLTAWLANADYIVLAVFVLAAALVALGLYRRRAAAACGVTSVKEQGFER